MLLHRDSLDFGNYFWFMKRNILFIVLALSIISCREKCVNPVDFQVSYVDPGTTIVLELDSGRFREEFKYPKGVYFTDKNRTHLVKNYCGLCDSVFVRAILDERYDTAFYIDRTEIKGCYFGTNISGRIRVFHDYYDGGLREYRFDD
jgi:hypothetical protein